MPESPTEMASPPTACNDVAASGSGPTPVERRAGFTLVEVEIATGVLHQIRAHLAFIGHPLAGDALYGGPELPGLSRHFLHAARLAFAHPDGTHPRFESPLSSELAAVLAQL